MAHAEWRSLRRLSRPTPWVLIPHSMFFSVFSLFPKCQIFIWSGKCASYPVSSRLSRILPGAFSFALLSPLSSKRLALSILHPAPLRSPGFVIEKVVAKIPISLCSS
jgi:hypothetical protein